MKLQEEALKFIELKSVCEEGNEEIINYLIPKFEEMGAKLILQHVPHSLADHSKRQFNLIGILGDEICWFLSTLYAEDHFPMQI